jgi:DHA2 family multidrug resistance protein
MIAMFLVGRIIGLVDIRLLILSGLALTAVSLYQMSGFSLVMDPHPIVVSGLIPVLADQNPYAQS